MVMVKNVGAFSVVDTLTMRIINMITHTVTIMTTSKKNIIIVHITIKITIKRRSMIVSINTSIKQSYRLLRKICVKMIRLQM